MPQMNLESFSSERLAELKQRYSVAPQPPLLSYGTVPDYCDSMDHLPELTTIQRDMKDLQRPWTFKTLLRTIPAGGRLLEIGAGEPHVAALLTRCGYEVWVVDPYDGSGRGPTEFEEFKSRYPGVHFIRDQFGTHLSEIKPAQFDCVYSISVLEHIPHKPLEDVLAATHRALRPRGWSIHAIDHVHMGKGSAYHLRTLEIILGGHGMEQGLLRNLLASVDSDVDAYFLSAESHNLWRGRMRYDEFPMRRVVSIHLAHLMA